MLLHRPNRPTYEGGSSTTKFSKFYVIYALLWQQVEMRALAELSTRKCNGCFFGCLIAFTHIATGTGLPDITQKRVHAYRTIVLSWKVRLSRHTFSMMFSTGVSTVYFFHFLHKVMYISVHAIHADDVTHSHDFICFLPKCL